MGYQAYVNFHNKSIPYLKYTVVSLRENYGQTTSFFSFNFSVKTNLGLCRPSFTCQCVCTCVCTDLPDVITLTKINVIHS